VQKSLLKSLAKLNRKNIMIIGDMVADVYLDGKISRISREAPVLILEYMGEKVVPGGAANAVNNLASLGGAVYAVGFVGDDNIGNKLIDELATKGVNTDGLIVDKDRPTITKTRIMAGGQATVRQQVVRIDRESKDPLAPATEKALLDYITANINQMKAVVISDYGSGTVTPSIIATVLPTCKKLNIPCIVDSRYNILAYKGCTVVKQNEAEAAAVLGYDLTDMAALNRAGWELLSRLEATAVLITRGPDGMSLYEATGEITHIPVTNKSEVYDVTGAGDTVVAAMSLALAAGVSFVDAARLANFAAGVVVRKPGTATTTLEEIKQAIGDHNEDSC